jgi:NAD(P)H-dependent FMN reductase
MTNPETKPRLHIITGSTRPGRVGPSVAAWFTAHARAADTFEIEVIDLAEVALPLLDEPHQPGEQKYTHEHTKAWSATISRADAVVFVIPEYNASMNAATKNALDYLYVEWHYKPLGIVSYGGISGGLRAAQAIKQVGAALKMIVMPDTVMIPRVSSLLTDAPADQALAASAMPVRTLTAMAAPDRTLTATPAMDRSASALLAELLKLTLATAPLRQ